ncbi:MAG: Re/Si-specific NAD(P)(+) transhydrogenase subunit alpha [Acidimicrobiales bacterium]
MRLAVPTETKPGEQRVALVPDALAKLTKAGVTVSIQAGAGDRAGFADGAYTSAGAEVVADLSTLLAQADLVARVQPPTLDEAAQLREGCSLVSFLAPAANLDLVAALTARRISAYSFELVPRISRAQSMDALSSQATVAGYRAVLLAANRLTKFFPMFMTAAGTVPPAKVLVMGAGVAGLQAIATSRRLGAVVSAYDVRTAARDEVRSLGASFVELALEAAEGAGGYAGEQTPEFLARQQELIATHIAASDVVITTAAIPGRRAPLLVTTAMVEGMKPGSLIVDLAAATGGNCELTEVGEEVRHNGVLILGPADIAATLPTHASALYARNVANLVLLMTTNGELAPDFEDAVIAGCCVTTGGEVRHAPTRNALAARTEGGP